jgi:hypothetical protein
MTINVCVGSSCHLKGSYDVIEGMKEMIAENHLEEQVELCASFCLGHCAQGVTVKVDEEFLENVNRDNVREVFRTEIMSRLQR